MLDSADRIANREQRTADPGSRTTDPGVLPHCDTRLARALVSCPIGRVEADHDRSSTTGAAANAEAEREPQIARLREFRAEFLNRHRRRNRHRWHVRTRDVSELHPELRDDHTGRSA